jgi:SAM-dependent methyltransferase
MQQEEWGTAAWHEAHFPQDRLDDEGDAWGIRWRGMEKLRHASYLNLLEPVLAGAHPLSVLDIGCALCDFTEKAHALNRANRFRVMDVARNAVAWVERRFPQFEAAVGALPEIPFEQEFDVILCLEVLGYLRGDQRKQAVEKICERLRPGGVLMFSGVLDGGRRYHSREEVIGMLSRGFEIVSVHYNHWGLYKRLVEQPLERVHMAVGARLDGALRAPGGLLKMLSALARALIASRAVAELAQAASRLRRDDADEIVVLARKPSVAGPQPQ